MRRLFFRPRAILCCFWFGLLPWQFYETQCHYAGISYRPHLWMNLRRAFMLCGKLSFGDVRFEIVSNNL